MDDLPNTMIQYAARVLAARVGAQAGSGTSGASLLTANLASQRMRDLLHGLTNDKAAMILRDAIRDPDLFRELLTADLRNPKQAARAERRLVEWMAAETGVAAGEDREAPADRQWWTNDPVAGERRSDAGGSGASRIAATGSIGGLIGPPGMPSPARPMPSPRNPRDAVVQALMANSRQAGTQPDANMRKLV